MPHGILVLLWFITISETAVLLLVPKLQQLGKQAKQPTEKKVLLTIGIVFAAWPFSLLFAEPGIAKSISWWQSKWNESRGKWWKVPLLLIGAPVLIALSVEHASDELSVAVAIGAIINLGLWALLLQLLNL